MSYCEGKLNGRKPVLIYHNNNEKKRKIRDERHFSCNRPRVTKITRKWSFLHLYACTLVKKKNSVNVADEPVHSFTGGRRGGLYISGVLRKIYPSSLIWSLRRKQWKEKKVARPWMWGNISYEDLCWGTEDHARHSGARTRALEINSLRREELSLSTPAATSQRDDFSPCLFSPFPLESKQANLKHIEVFLLLRFLYPPPPVLILFFWETPQPQNITTKRENR